MSSFYLQVYRRLPEFLKRRINPLDYAIEDFVKTAAVQEPRQRVLDAGAGEARFAGYFSKHFYVALDACIGDSLWDYSRIQLIADLAALPLRESSLDAVLNIQVLEHVKDPALVVAQLHRVLKPGGRLFLTAPQGWAEHQQPHDFYRFTSFALKHLLVEAGFTQIEVKPLGGYFHYLGNRLTQVPKVLFPPLPRLWRVLLFPVELGTLALFCLACPIACYYLDRFDGNQEFTLGYRCLARK
jgi:SAM-dependent methyltransferase